MHVMLMNDKDSRGGAILLQDNANVYVRMQEVSWGNAVVLQKNARFVNKCKLSQTKVSQRNTVVLQKNANILCMLHSQITLNNTFNVP